jgi:aldehyde:ferredoxin oxidoreductase
VVGGYAGRILSVNLTDGSIKEEQLPEKVYRDFLGGFGIEAKILYERMKAKVDPLGPDNILGFMTGPLTGVRISWAARWSVAAKSPLTGTWGDSNAGGRFGVELKKAGYDGVFFSGISPKPVYLWLSDGKAELREAAHLWGKDTFETKDILCQELADKTVSVACIGPAGESMSLIAAVVADKGRVAARSGLGAVMGAKRLKAVAVKGKSKVEVADEPRLRALRQRVTSGIEQLRGLEFQGKFQTPSGYIETGGVTLFPKYSTCLSLSRHVLECSVPIKNWQAQGIGEKAFPKHAKISGNSINKYEVKRDTCPHCIIACKGYVTVDKGPFAVSESKKPEYETLASFGPNCFNDNVESIIKANDLCNRNGLDTISAGSTIAFAMESYERGVISKEDTEGIELTWGNADAIIALLKKMVKREGIGALFADGSAKAAERIGKGSEQWAIHYHGQEPGNYDPRVWPAYACFYAYEPVQGRHTGSDILSLQERAYNLPIYPDVKIPEVDVYDCQNKGKGVLYAVVTSHDRVVSASGLCMFTEFLPPFPLVEVIGAVTGWDFTAAEALTTGRRIETLRQLFNIREGLTAKDFNPPDRLKQPLTTGPYAGVNIDFDALRRSYFEAMGWDDETGKPSKQTLQELGLTYTDF